MPTIGYLAALSEAADRPRRAAFAKRLGELGWIENSNVRIDCRWANGIVGNAATIAAEFVRSKVDVIVSSGDTYVLAVRRATSTIPIVFASAGDPVGNGLVQSMARPGGNVTGLSIELTESVGKRLEILREIVPGLRRLAILFNAGDPLVNAWPLADIETAPRNVRFQGGYSDRRWSRPKRWRSPAYRHFHFAVFEMMRQHVGQPHNGCARCAVNL
jgi:putative ABC transport system substrate-binding protein